MLLYSAREAVTCGPTRGMWPACISARIFAGSGGGDGRMVATSKVRLTGAVCAAREPGKIAKLAPNSKYEKKNTEDFFMGLLRQPDNDAILHLVHGCRVNSRGSAA